MSCFLRSTLLYINPQLSTSPYPSGGLQGSRVHLHPLDVNKYYYLLLLLLPIIACRSDSRLLVSKIIEGVTACIRRTRQLIHKAQQIGIIANPESCSPL